MLRLPPRSTRTDTLSPSPTLFRSLTDELTHGARHFRFTLDLLDIKILGVLVGPVIGVHRLAERFHRDFELIVERRSEEHTSELQSLMSISYAVFCLKKKKRTYSIPNSDKQQNRTQY